jgi:hypothetical protein
MFHGSLNNVLLILELTYIITIIINVVKFIYVCAVCMYGMRLALSAHRPCCAICFTEKASLFPALGQQLIDFTHSLCYNIKLVNCSE